MSLAVMEHLLYNAKKNKRAVGAFNIANMEALMGVIKAAEYSNTPIIIQIAEKRITHSPLYLLGPMMVNAAKKSKVDIAVQLDHGYSLDIIDEAIEYGFTSIMYDGSHFPIEENIKNTNMIYEHLKNKKVNLKELIKILGEEKNIDSVLIEGGSILHASLLKEKLIDKALIYIAPKIFGGLNAKTPISGEGIKEIEKAIKLIDGNIEKIGEDLFMEYYLKY